MAEPLKVGLAGLGTVGSAVVDLLERGRDKLIARCGRSIEIVAVSARSRSKKRGIDLKKYRWSADPVTLARDPSIDVFVELMGGAGDPAKRAVETALASGKAGRDSQQGAIGTARPKTRRARRTSSDGAELRGFGVRRHSDR